MVRPTYSRRYVPTGTDAQLLVVQDVRLGAVNGIKSLYTLRKPTQSGLGLEICPPVCTPP
jgi:hypothetical protein